MPEHIKLQYEISYYNTESYILFLYSTYRKFPGMLGKCICISSQEGAERLHETARGAILTTTPVFNVQASTSIADKLTSTQQFPNHSPVSKNNIVTPSLSLPFVFPFLCLPLPTKAHVPQGLCDHVWCPYRKQQARSSEFNVKVTKLLEVTKNCMPWFAGNL